MSVSDPTTRQTIEVTILGQRMLLKAEEDSKHIERLASYVNRKVDEVSGGGSVATTKRAILAALNIANDYFRELDQSNEFKQWVAEKSRSLLAELDSSDSDEMPEQGLG